MPRVFIRFPDAQLLTEAAAGLRAHAPATAFLAPRTSDTLIADLTPSQIEAAQATGAEVFDDIQFEIFDPFEWRSPQMRYWDPTDQPAFAHLGSLDDVVDQVRAPEVWQRTRGDGVTIAVVDSGICSTLNEIPASKQSTIDLASTFAGSHWSDPTGHGSMCAAIAGGTMSAGGRFNGVAPDSRLLAARSDLTATDIYAIYDELITLKRAGVIPGPLIVSNSYGLYTCSPPAGFPENHPYLQIILDAIDEGIVVVFAAGNNHWDVLCQHDPKDCSPTTIWAVNSHERVISVGTVNQNESNQDPSTPHPNSSRGPGQWSINHPKPDCVAPTYGEVVWGCSYRTMPWWGTSGACPQVAGLAALLLSLDPNLTPADVADTIRSTARSLAAPHNCVGHGIIDCRAAVDTIP